MTPRPLALHLIAIGGTGMAPLACLLQGEGHQVTGSDGPLYPPMSDLLASAGIRPFVGYDPAHLEPAPDLVVVGNAVPRHNPEALATEARGLARLSMPAALARFFLAEREPLVVAGTHGKTTTSAMAAWVWREAGRDPGYLVGGAPLDLPASFHRGSGPRFVVEGDEYNAAYFDRGAKFLHYRPQALVVTSVEYDHADLYPTPAALLAAYEQLFGLVPESGFAVVCGDEPELVRLARATRAPVTLYGTSSTCDVRLLGGPRSTAEGARFRLRDPELGEIEVALGVWGEHNATNALAVWSAARQDGIAPATILDALARFRGVRRRQQELATVGGVTVLDDFAHHPTAVGKTLASLRDRFPGRRLVACFEPRSLTAGRSFFRDGYRLAFAGADRVHLAPLFHRDRLSAEDRLDVVTLAAELTNAGVLTDTASSNDELLGRVVAEARVGDVIVTMSSGAFDRLPQRLVAALTAASAG